MDDRRRGIKLTEIMVVIFVTGIFVGLFLPAVTTNCTVNCRAQCRNNMRQVGLGLLGYSNAYNRFPTAGTFFDDPADHHGDPTRSNIYRAITNPASFTAGSNPCVSNWVTAILPYIDNQEIFNATNFQVSYLSAATNAPNVPSNLQITSTSIRILACPDDPTTQLGQGNLSYVVNGGFARWYPIPVGWVGGAKDGQSWNGDVLHWSDAEDRVAIGRKLGVMFLGAHTGDQPWDVKTTPSDINDGASSTLLVAENTLAGYSTGTPYSGGLLTNWACPLPNYCMFLGSDDVCGSSASETDCLAGRLAPTPDGQSGPGWSWANHPKSYERINYGSKLTVEGSSPFANSGHSGGGNFVFCDGSVRFLRDTIDGEVYAQIITPAGSRLPPSLREGKLNREALEP